MKGIIIFLFVVYAAVGHTKKITVKLVEECPKEQEEDWTIEYLIRHEDCNKFYKCTFGKPVEMKCPENLWFNLDTQRCDWRENVDCSDRNVPGEETTIPTPGPTTVRPTEPPTEPPTSTTTPEITTTTTTSTIPPTIPPSTPAPTTPAPTTTAVPTTTSDPATTSFPTLPNGCPVDPHIHWLLPHETDCNAFYYCVWGQLVERNCPPTLHFNRVIQVCDWPWDAGCPATFNKHLESRKLLR